MKDLPEKPFLAKELSEAGLHDLSRKRDEICVPIAHEIIKELAKLERMPVGSHVNEKEINVNAVYLPVVKSIMQSLIDNDVKIMDVVYIFNLARQGIEFVQSSIDETLNQNMNRVTETVYGLDLNKAHDVSVGQLNKVVQKQDKIGESVKSILAE